MNDNLELIISSCTGLIVLAVALYGSYRLRRRWLDAPVNSPNAQGSYADIPQALHD
jgi:hypothetical protein